MFPTICIHTCMLLANISLSSLYFAKTSSFNSECYSCSFVPLFIILGFTWNMHETQMDSPVHKHFHKWMPSADIHVDRQTLTFQTMVLVLLPVNSRVFQEQSIETCRLKQFRHWIGSLCIISLVCQTCLIAVFFPLEMWCPERVYLMQFCYGPIFSPFIS